MSDHPDNNSIHGFIEALLILAKYELKGVNAKYFLEADHDVIYSHVSTKDCPENSKDGQMLEALGWHVDNEIDMWAYFT